MLLPSHQRKISVIYFPPIGGSICTISIIFIKGKLLEVIFLQKNLKLFILENFKHT